MTDDCLKPLDIFRERGLWNSAGLSDDVIDAAVQTGAGLSGSWLRPEDGEVQP